MQIEEERPFWVDGPEGTFVAEPRPLGWQVGRPDSPPVVEGLAREEALLAAYNLAGGQLWNAQGPVPNYAGNLAAAALRLTKVSPEASRLIYGFSLHEVPPCKSND
jgi:hypothetical protein